MYIPSRGAGRRRGASDFLSDARCLNHLIYRKELNGQEEAASRISRNAEPPLHTHLPTSRDIVILSTASTSASMLMSCSPVRLDSRFWL